MKRILLSILIFPLIFAACKDDGGIGLSIQPQGDEIKVVVDTFYIAAQDSALIAISAQCSDSLSMLLGEYYSEKYGSTKAELIVQIAPPLDYTFPDEAINNPTVDSLVMLMLYRHWFGSKREPLEISIYKMDNKSPEYSKQYFTDFPISDFSTKSTLLGTTIMTSIDQTLDDSITSASGYIPSIRYKFNNDLAQDLFNVTKAGISSTQDFLENFKGVYITTTYGQSTMLYLQGIEMRLFYHYNYEKNGVDTVVNTYIRFPANKEVRQLNKITHVNTENVVNQYDSVSYLKTGGG
ncbi:MAG: DUF4270 domain-containing protein, partial [Paludibacter sp.]|nr:DUF4270 domain-containing protein [Paludibacter sp.]